MSLVDFLNEVTKSKLGDSLSFYVA